MRRVQQGNKTHERNPMAEPLTLNVSVLCSIVACPIQKPELKRRRTAPFAFPLCHDSRVSSSSFGETFSLLFWWLTRIYYPQAGSGLP